MSSRSSALASASTGLAAAVATIAWSRRARGVAGSGHGAQDPPKQTTWSTSTASAMIAGASIAGTTRAAPWRVKMANCSVGKTAPVRLRNPVM